MNEETLRKLIPKRLIVERDVAGSSPGEWATFDIYRKRRGDMLPAWIASITYFAEQPDKGLSVWKHGDSSPANVRARRELAQALADVGPFSDDYFRQFSEYGPRAANNYPVGVC